MRTFRALRVRNAKECHLGSGERNCLSRSLPGLGCGLSGGAETGGGRRGGGALIWTAASLSYLTSGVGPTLEAEGRQRVPRLSGEKLEHHIEEPLFPNEPPFLQLFSCSTGGCFYGTMTLNLIHRSKLCCVCARSCVCVCVWNRSDS